MIAEVCKAVLDIFKTEVYSNTVFATHMDYIELAKLPALILYWPEATEWRVVNTDRTVTKNPDSTTTIQPAPQLFNLTFECEVLAETLADLGLLEDKLQALFRNKPYWLINGIEYPARLISLATGITRQGEQVRRIVARFMVEGIEFYPATYTGKQVLEADYNFSELNSTVNEAKKEVF